MKVTDWQLERSALENDFVDYLKQQFVQDLKDRHNLSKDRNAPFPAQIRRGVALDSTQELIMTVHKNTFGLRASLAAVEAELAEIKRKEQEQAKINKHINDLIEVKQAAPYKRQNSYDLMLDDFCDESSKEQVDF